MFYDVIFAADHLAIAALESPDYATRADIHIVQAFRGQFFCAPNVVNVVGVSSINEDVAFFELRDQIVTLAITPGAPIDEDLLGQQLEMGRTPVREAIKRLALENLVTVFPRRGTFASEINITDLNHISDVRFVLEGHAALRAAERVNTAQREELEALLLELGQSKGSDDQEALMTLDASVHRFIYRCTGNPYLEETLTRYFNLSLRIWHLVIDRLPHLFARVHEHDEVLRAIAAGEGELARDVLCEHIAIFEQEIRTVL